MTDDCWIWTASLSEGYGQTYWNGCIGPRAHRVSYEAFNGPIPKGWQVQHKCDQKACVNPKHLKLGKPVNNTADIFSRGEPELTPHEFERLCAELAELDRNVETSNLRREQIEKQLRRTIKDHRGEHNSIIKDHRLAMRLQRRRLAEEREQERQEQHAEMLSRRIPEARAKLQASIAELKECTKEELRQEAIEAQIKAKQDRAASRRWKNENGHASEEQR
jgi:hypothetical protein